MTAVRAGVVGTGHMGRYHVAVYSGFADVELAGIVDTNEELVRGLAAQYNTTPYTDYRELFGRVDLVSIAVPTSLHHSVAKEFLRNGMHVLLEKPITKDLEQAHELFAVAAEHEVVLHIGHVERFNGAVQELKKIVEKPILIEARRLGPFRPRIEDDGVVLDLMIHDIDIILGLVAEPIAHLAAHGVSVFSPHEDVANVQMTFEGGCVATLTASRATQHKVRTMAVTQQDAYVFLNFTDQDIHIHRQASTEHLLTREQLRYKQESLVERVFVYKDNPLKSEIRHLIDCALDGAKRAVSVEDELKSLTVALEVLELVHANRRAYRTVVESSGQ
ncbi:MAG: Gfo/Idh/MocA family oxidoreductase [Nitrospinae bacterium]|nr:Gfo/Idh/MocA family oxidoreductase [Nitrospinota bacterium]